MLKFSKKASAEHDAIQRAAFERHGVKTMAEAEQLIFDTHGIDVAAMRHDIQKRSQPSRALRLWTVWSAVAAGALIGGTHVQAVVGFSVFVNALALVLIREWGGE